MIDALPIKLITDTDEPLFGANLFHLGKLSRLGFPVVVGVAVAAPEIVLATVLKHIQLKDEELFEQKLTIVKADLHKIKIPEELEKLFKNEDEAFLLRNGKLLFFSGQLYTSKKIVWEKLLDVWLQELRAGFWQNGFSGEITRYLTPQAVFFTGKQFVFAEAFFDPGLEDVVIRCEKKLEPSVAQKIDQLVLDANKKLLLPQNYNFLVSKKNVQIISVSPFTQSLPASQLPQVIMSKAGQEKVIGSAVKLFLNMSSGFALATRLDGVLIEGEKIKNFDEAVFKLLEASLSLPSCPVIYELPNVPYLTHQKAILDEAARIFLFVRNKKSVTNIEIAVPATRSVDELLQIKRELAAREITRKGSLKIWWEAGTPENLINLENYLEAGMDGVILNLDVLHQLLEGYKSKEENSKQTQALTKFTEPALKILHKAKIPVLAKGEMALGTDMLNWLLKSGVWGVVANSALEAENLPEYLAWTEKRLVNGLVD